MSNTGTRQYTITLPNDTADLFDKFCAEQPNSPVNNIASRCISDGIEATAVLHPDWARRLGHVPHPMSTAARLHGLGREVLEAGMLEVHQTLEAENKRLREALEGTRITGDVVTPITAAHLDAAIYGTGVLMVAHHSAEGFKVEHVDLKRITIDGERPPQAFEGGADAQSDD